MKMKKIGYNPKDKIPAAKNKPRWQWALEAKSTLYILGLLSDSEKLKVEKRFDKWLTSWNLHLKQK